MSLHTSPITHVPAGAPRHASEEILLKELGTRLLTGADFRAARAGSASDEYFGSCLPRFALRSPPPRYNSSLNPIPSFSSPHCCFPPPPHNLHFARFPVLELLSLGRDVW